MDKNFNVWLAKRMLNDISGIANKNKKHISYANIDLMVEILLSWYNSEISKNEAHRKIDILYKE